MKKFREKSMKLDGWSGYDYFKALGENIKAKLRAICGLDKWHYIALIKEGKKKIIYKDGIPFISQDSCLSISSNDYWDFSHDDFTIDFFVIFTVRIREWSLTARRNLINYIF